MWCNLDFAPSQSAAFYQFFDTDGARHAFYQTNVANRFSIYNDGRYTDFDVTGLWTVGTWAHFACVYNKTGNVQQLYVNGAAATVAGVPTGVWGSTALGTNFYVGQRFAAAYSFLDGRIAEVGVYSVAKTASEIAALATSAEPRLSPRGISGYVPLVTDSGVPLFGQYAGTLVGAPAAAAHCRVTRHGRSQIGVPSAVAAPSVTYPMLERFHPRGTMRGCV